MILSVWQCSAYLEYFALISICIAENMMDTLAAFLFLLSLLSVLIAESSLFCFPPLTLFQARFVYFGCLLLLSLLCSLTLTMTLSCFHG